MKFIHPPNRFILAARPILKSRTASLEGVMDCQCWMSCFGAEPEVVVNLWMRIDPKMTMPKGAKAKHIMWTLYVLKLYNAQEVNIQNIDRNPVEKTFRKWVWLFIEAISTKSFQLLLSHCCFLYLCM